MGKTLIEHSRTNYNSEQGSLEVINAGSLQRIAVATERMAANYTALQNDRDYYKSMYESKRDYSEKLLRKITAMKGVITKLKSIKP